MCWNGDMENPKYRNTAGQTNKWIKGRFLSSQLAHYDTTIEKLAFDGPHEADRLEKSSNGWHGGTNAQDYITEKLLMRSIVKANPQPYASYGKSFLSEPGNKAFYDKLYFVVKAPGCVAAQKPSEMFSQQ